MGILDRQRYWSFFKAYLICFGSLVGLYVVIDAFTNVDEFTKVEDKFLGVMRLMGRYYLVRIPLFYDRLCGVITMMAAIFTVTWMQRNNELLAMLAAGISTHRVIVPVIVSSALVSGVAFANQEWVVPRVAEELQRTPDDDGRRGLVIHSHRDVNDVNLGGTFAFRDTQSIAHFNATLPSSRFGSLIQITGLADDDPGSPGAEARYVPDDDPTCPLRGGWLIRGARAAPADAALDGRVLVRVGPEPAWLAVATAGAGTPLDRALQAVLPPPRTDLRKLEGGTFFLRTNLTFAMMTRSKLWYQFASTPELLASLKDPSCETERPEIAVSLHGRNLRPLLSLTLLCLSLPLVLGGMARNTFVNLGRALGTSAVFYLCLLICSYLGSNRVLSPELSAWAPLIGFGCVAASRWDQIRT